MSKAKDVAVAMLGARPVSAAFRWGYRSRLRVLAYHGVPDPVAFERQLDRVILPSYTVVSGRTVVESIRSGASLPDRAVWITFDDGLASVVEHALPLLVDRGVTASMFVCPGVVDGSQRHWWETVAAALECGWRLEGTEPSATERVLKSAPDARRREALAEAQKWLDGHLPVSDRQPSSASGRSQIAVWLSAGMELGNHTWDHPCLDQCSPLEQARQIERADRWLSEIGAFDGVKLFAYPNGDWSLDAEQELVRLRYDVGLLFDHQLAAAKGHAPIRMSRLRLDSAANPKRTRAILSGGHSSAFFVRDPATTALTPRRVPVPE